MTTDTIVVTLAKPTGQTPSPEAFDRMIGQIRAAAIEHGFELQSCGQTLLPQGLPQ